METFFGYLRGLRLPLFFVPCNQNATKYQKYVENKCFSVGSNPMSSAQDGNPYFVMDSRFSLKIQGFWECQRWHDIADFGTKVPLLALVCNQKCNQDFRLTPRNVLIICPALFSPHLTASLGNDASSHNPSATRPFSSRRHRGFQGRERC